jgi:hypothetical protein
MKELNQLTNRLSALNLQIFRRGLASVRDFLVFNGLTLVQTGEAGFLDRRDVNKHIFAATLRLKKRYAAASGELWLESNRDRSA